MKKSDSNRQQSKNSMAAQPPDCPRLQSRAIDAYGGKLPKGKKFAGWATSKANAKNGKVKYKNAQAVKNLIITGKTVKLYAVWKKK